MDLQLRRWLWSAALSALVVALATPDAPCADAPPASGAVPAAPADGGEVPPAPTPPQEPPTAFVLPAPDYNIEPVPALTSPLLDRPEAASPGFFANVETSVVWPHFTNELLGGALTPAQLSSQPPSTQGVAPTSAIGLPPGAGLPITGDIVRFPGNPLNATVSPRFELGYRFQNGFGEVRLSYRFVDTRGSDTVLVAPPVANDSLGLAAQTGRLALNIVDLDYGTREFSLGPNWELRTAVGVRYATAFLDSQVVFLNPVTVTGAPFGTGPFTRLSQSEALSNQYAGVHAILEVDRKLPLPGLGFFGRVEGAGMWGRAQQTFRETFVEAPGSTELRVTNHPGTPWLNSQVGFSYDVPRWNHSRFLIGYQFEEWWQLGRGDNDLSFGRLNIQGLFLRAELNF
jgi:hypothetical protein